MLDKLHDIDDRGAAHPATSALTSAGHRGLSAQVLSSDRAEEPSR